MKNLKINWKEWIIFLIVVAGLLYLTGSFWITSGILVLLLLVDGLLRDYDNRRRGKQQIEDIKRRLEEQDESSTTDDNQE